MEKLICARLLLLGKNVDTDQIYPGRYLELVEPEEIGAHCLEGVDGAIAKSFVKGDVVVAAENFGCGSSREHAAIALLNMGVSCVVAHSFARIFFRNGINLGLPLVVCPNIAQAAINEQRIQVDIGSGKVTLPDRGIVLQGERLGAHAMGILAAGGIKELFADKKAYYDLFGRE